MSETFIFEELDDDTRSYLTAVRDAEGKGMPGMFAPTNTAFPGCSCLAGVLLIPLTLAVTLTDMLNIVFDDPVRVAFLQTAGLLVGGWLLFAYFRAKGTRGSARTAGYWAYMDPLHLYVAYREQVTVTRMDDAVEAKYTHNYNNGNYQNSVVRIVLGDRKTTSFTLNQELRAEQFVVFVNYLGWARGTDGGEMGELPPATLGAVARYVARHDVEPKNADGTINMDLVNLDIDEVPEEPRREGRATPSFLPYIVMILAAIAIFLVMAFVVNPPIRDEALYKAVTHPPTEPRVLRAYLLDSRNTLYRKEVLSTLSALYQGVISFVRENAQQAELKAGMLRILTLLREEPNQPVVSLRVTERSPPNLSNGDSAKNRVKKLREGLVGGDGNGGQNRQGILDEFAVVSPPISGQGGEPLTPPPPPIGHQLIAFVEPPEEAKEAHFEIAYEFKPTEQPDFYLLSVMVEIRETIDGQPIATYTTDLSTYKGDDSSLNTAIDDLRANLVLWMVGEHGHVP